MSSLPRPSDSPKSNGTPRQAPCPRCRAPLDLAEVSCPCCGGWAHVLARPLVPPPPPRPLYVATDCGEYVESDFDLEHLLHVLVTEIMEAGGDSDVTVLAGLRVVAVVRGDDLTTVLVR
jgi:hypothetical protein